MDRTRTLEFLGKRGTEEVGRNWLTLADALAIRVRGLAKMDCITAEVVIANALKNQEGNTQLICSVEM
jgi:hypothetical protein